MARPRQNEPDAIPLFPVVGIGASAGGLAAFECFIEAVPEKTGISFVFIAHLDPVHESALPEIIQKKTKMKVFQVYDNMVLKPDCVFIIPPTDRKKNECSQYA
ncbi:MAG: hypothetical protein JEY91_17050 [Spirochaetaceae bacterium]|nr:hypothetical protein [Spirochaetaceae bacterium]